MLKRDKLEAMLSKITDDEFGAIWKDTYGILQKVAGRNWQRTLWRNNMTESWTAASHLPILS